MKKYSLTKWMALPLAAIAITSAADLDAAYGSGYTSYGNYQPYTGYSYNQQLRGSQTTNPNYGPLNQGYQNYAAQGWGSTQQYWTNSNAARSNSQNSAVPFFHPGQQPGMQYGYSQFGSNNQCPNAQYGAPQDLNRPNLFGQCLSPDPKNPTAGCPSGYRTGYSANYFSEPISPVNGGSILKQYNAHTPHWKAYGPQPSYTTYANQVPETEVSNPTCGQQPVPPQGDNTQPNLPQRGNYGQQSNYGQSNIHQGH